MKRKLIATVALAFALLVIPAAASAAPPEGSFGSHVSQHARTIGFDGTHNPGMHQGAAGWMLGDHH